MNCQTCVKSIKSTNGMKIIQKWTTFLFNTVIALELTSFSASAATISQLSSGTNNTIIDSDQNLVWLKLTESLDKSVQDIKSNPNPGFRLATNAEVKRLVSGIQNTAYDVYSFLDLFGSTQVIYGYYSYFKSWGLYPSNTFGFTNTTYFEYSPAEYYKYYYGSYGFFSSDFNFSESLHSSGYGVYQVKTNAQVQVPESSNVFGLGLLGLGLAVTKMKSLLLKRAKTPTDNPQEPDN